MIFHTTSCFFDLEPVNGALQQSQCSRLIVCSWTNVQEEYGVKARRLPIPEYAEVLQIDPTRQTRPVLNVSDVAIALCTLWQEGNWVEALDLAVSRRKRQPQRERKKKIRASRGPPATPGSVRDDRSSGARAGPGS